MGRIEERLAELGIVLPTLTPPLANYVVAKRVGNLVHTAGMVSALAGQEYKGKLGADLDIAQGQAAARASALGALAAIRTVVDSLDRVRQVVAVHGLISSAPGFDGQAAVMNGASDLMVAVFGEAGRHTRTAAGVAGLPLNFATSVYVIVEVE